VKFQGGLGSTKEALGCGCEGDENQIDAGKKVEIVERKSKNTSGGQVAIKYNF
jgi:hypothetical protein